MISRTTGIASSMMASTARSAIRCKGWATVLRPGVGSRPFRHAVEAHDRNVLGHAPAVWRAANRAPAAPRDPTWPGSPLVAWRPRTARPGRAPRSRGQAGSRISARRARRCPPPPARPSSQAGGRGSSSRCRPVPARGSGSRCCSPRTRCRPRRTADAPARADARPRLGSAEVVDGDRGDCGVLPIERERDERQPAAPGQLHQRLAVLDAKSTKPSTSALSMFHASFCWFWADTSATPAPRASQSPRSPPSAPAPTDRRRNSSAALPSRPRWR